MEKHQVVRSENDQLHYEYLIKETELNHRISMLRNLAVAGWLLFVISLVVRGHQ